MLKLSLLTQFFPPETAAGANRTGALAAALAARHALRVHTLAPGYPEPALYDGVDWAAADAARGFPVQRGPAFKPHDRSLVKRAWREIGMSRALVDAAAREWRAAGERPDVVLVSTPSMFLAPFAAGWARRTGARFVWDVRDLTWRYARESAPTSGVQRFLLGGLEAFLMHEMKRADLAVAATAGLGRVLVREGVPESRVHTLANGVPRAWLARFANAAGAPAVRRASLRSRVSYVGLMGYNHGIGVLVEAAAKLAHVDFVLVGDGPEREGIAASIAERGLRNVTLAPYATTPEALEAHYRASDVLVSHTRSTPILDDIVFPAKSYEYFATGVPVVYAGTGWAADVLREQDLACVVPPQDPAALAEGIARTLAEPQAAAARAARARATVEREWCREDQLARLVEELERRFA
ncbi:MAG: glycosyltransferase family 4 protein [Candidatus Eisenbacteria bacterium]